MRLVAVLLLSALAGLAGARPLPPGDAPPGPSAPAGPTTPPDDALDVTPSLPPPPDAPGATALPAEEEQRLPEALRAPANLLCGRVEGLRGDQLRLKGHDQPLYLDRGTQVREAGRPAGREALGEGEQVRASFDLEHGRRVAHRLTVGEGCP